MTHTKDDLIHSLQNLQEETASPSFEFGDMSDEQLASSGPKNTFAQNVEKGGIWQALTYKGRPASALDDTSELRNKKKQPILKSEIYRERSYLIQEIALLADKGELGYFGQKNLITRLSNTLCQKEGDEKERRLKHPEIYLQKWLGKLDTRQLYGLMMGNSLRYMTSAHYYFSAIPDAERESLCEKLKDKFVIIDLENIRSVENKIVEIKKLKNSNPTLYATQADDLFRAINPTFEEKAIAKSCGEKLLAKYSCTKPFILDYMDIRALAETNLTISDVLAKKVKDNKDKLISEDFKRLRLNDPVNFGNDPDMVALRGAIKDGWSTPSLTHHLHRTPSGVRILAVKPLQVQSHLDVSGQRKSPITSILEEYNGELGQQGKKITGQPSKGM